MGLDFLFMDEEDYKDFNPKEFMEKSIKYHDELTKEIELLEDKLKNNGSMKLKKELEFKKWCLFDTEDSMNDTIRHFDLFEYEFY